jgi:hypothetical protein
MYQIIGVIYIFWHHQRSLSVLMDFPSIEHSPLINIAMEMCLWYREEKGYGNPVQN